MGSKELNISTNLTGCGGGDEGEGGGVEGSLKYNVHMVGFVRMLLQVHGSLLMQTDYCSPASCGVTSK